MHTQYTKSILWIMKIKINIIRINLIQIVFKILNVYALLYIFMNELLTFYKILTFGRVFAFSAM